MKTVLIKIIKIYQKFISPLFPASCRYYPSCSQYMINHVQKRGVIIGLIKACLRILRCNVFFKGGIDY